VLADVATYTGMLTLASMVVSRLVFQHAGWGVAASVTPAVMGVAGTVFFAGSLLAGLPSLSPETAAAVAGIGATAGVVTQVRVAWRVAWSVLSWQSAGVVRQVGQQLGQCYSLFMPHVLLAHTLVTCHLVAGTHILATLCLCHTYQTAAACCWCSGLRGHCLGAAVCGKCSAPAVDIVVAVCWGQVVVLLA
jgi:hypothetical protein